MARTKSPASSPSTATVGFEAKLWLAADKLRNNMDAAEYKHVVLVLIFRRDLHRDLRTDYVLANPPFNESDWFRKDDDVRWQFGVPPKDNANFAWVQHFIHQCDSKENQYVV